MWNFPLVPLEDILTWGHSNPITAHFSQSHLRLYSSWLNKSDFFFKYLTALYSWTYLFATSWWFGHFRVLSIILMSFFSITYSNVGFGRNQSHKVFFFLTEIQIYSLFFQLYRIIYRGLFFWQRKKWRCQKYKVACWTHQKAPKYMP